MGQQSQKILVLRQQRTGVRSVSRFGKKGNELLPEQLLWIDGGGIDIDAARECVWNWRQRK